ncbi:MAG: hypothetical protein A3K19_30240 [Lentisphaerae bacterium RIFOXYB12_FULL_65_16]|nr:MAG: hypothetical protein A3K18_18725 [Lentisphaerae bacterium RIFOXYA12_64_32]OGV85853.1 MAG: hypothetical protein A3K19_30240 [Lentisphaerae bacterium RIFOXYB12_FULL_65_16]
MKKRIWVWASLVVFAAAAAPCGAAHISSNWHYMKTATIAASQVEADLTDFPVLISLTDSDLAAKAQADGDDIVFTLDGEVAILDSEIERYDNGTGALQAWVRVPALSSTADTVLNMHYGNPYCGSMANAAGVWDDHHVMVLHLNEASGNHADATGNGNTGAPQNGVAQGSTGKVAGADEFDCVDDVVQVATEGNFDFTQQFTLSAWVRPEGTATYNAIVGKYGYNGTGTGWDLILTNGRARMAVRGTSQIDTGGSAGPDLRNGNWHFVAATVTTSQISLYVDGVNVQNVTGAWVPATNDLPVTIGNRSGSLPFDGGIDEVRVSDNVRSADWLNTYYNNQNSPATFISIGAEQPGPLSDGAPVMPDAIPGADGGGVTYDFWIALAETEVSQYVPFLNAAETASAIAIADGEVRKATTNELYCVTTAANPDASVAYDAQANLGERFSAVSGHQTHPMTFVSWFGAAAFCNWRSTVDSRTAVYDPANGWAATLTNTGYRLPQEAEWYKAAAWDSTAEVFRTYGTGSDTLAAADANYLNSGDEFEAGAIRTCPGGYHDKTSPYGLFAASGNVWEWCHSFYDAQSSDEDVNAHATRGGSWGNLAEDVKTTSRCGFKPGQVLNSVGFRIMTTTAPQ